MSPLSISITLTEHKKSYSPLITENLMGWPDWTPPTPEEVEAHDKQWDEELCNSNYLRATLVDSGSGPPCQVAVESAWFNRDDPHARAASIPELFKMIGEAIQNRSLLTLQQTQP